MKENDSNLITLNDHDQSSTARAARSRSAWRIAIVPSLLAVLIALGVVKGIGSRTEAQAALHEAAKESAIPVVEIVHPKQGTATPEIALPGNTQAFNDTPIYARTSGYVSQWYLDIGAHVTREGLLATIETPEPAAPAGTG
jgi:multidrug efflux pump subunit AcrA (membrane-fusion protein)